ncbi:MAG: CAAX amino terminal protease self- immunity [Candidatus Omnitrophica bacterium ADurb.Bin277]|nr:MAG: CAAX amino terminal protease self- immunity [Candidatus Omnitrophica bacterium ADurb.Bin277]
MLKEIFFFFKKNRLYLWLLFLIGAFYAFAALGSGSGVQNPAIEPSQAVQRFKEAERQFTDNTSVRADAFDVFAKKEPRLALLFELFSIFFILAIVAGIVIDILIWVRPGFRKRFLGGTEPPASRGWPFSILFKTIILFVAWGIALSFVMGIVEAIFPAPGLANLYMVFHTFLLDILCVLFMVRFVKQQGSSWRELGFNVPGGKKLREVMIGVTGYFGVLPVFVLVLVTLLFAANLFHYEPPPHPLVNVFIEEERRFPFLVVFSVLLGAVIGPIFEEIFFRGFCYPILRGKVGKFWAVVLSSAFFASIHHTGFVFWPIFVLGVALALLYESRRSLVAPITLHIVHNSLFIGYFFLLKQIIGSNA